MLQTVMGVTESKTSPRHLNFLKKLKKNIKMMSLLSFNPRGGHGRRNILMDSHPYSYETSIFTPGVPHEEVQGRQTKLNTGFTLGKLVQPSPGTVNQGYFATLFTYFLSLY